MAAILWSGERRGAFHLQRGSWALKAKRYLFQRREVSMDPSRSSKVTTREEELWGEKSMG
jgi:hypothetical protein